MTARKNITNDLIVDKAIRMLVDSYGVLSGTSGGITEEEALRKLRFRDLSFSYRALRRELGKLPSRLSPHRARAIRRLIEERMKSVLDKLAEL